MIRMNCFSLVIYLLPACTMDSTRTSLAAKVPELVSSSSKKVQFESSDAPLQDCQTLELQCPAAERKLPYQCVAYRLAGKLLWQEERIYAWGKSLCQARRGLALAACERKLEPAAMGDIHCAPDSTAESCPVISKNCPIQEKPTRCIAQRYKNEEIPWSERPASWGANECKARALLFVTACQRGLNPHDLGDITCDADRSGGTCPPIAPHCKEIAGPPTTCQVSKIDEITLKKPWVAVAASACEAQYRLKQLACLFTDAAKNVNPEQLSRMECQSLTVQPFF